MEYAKELEETDGVTVVLERVSRFSPVVFDSGIVELVEKHARARGLSCRRITSGAGQDAQNMAVICPTAMIFSPSANGISHNPREYTKDEDLIACADVLLGVLAELAGAAEYDFTVRRTALLGLDSGGNPVGLMEMDP